MIQSCNVLSIQDTYCTNNRDGVIILYTIKWLKLWHTRGFDFKLPVLVRDLRKEDGSSVHALTVRPQQYLVIWHTYHVMCQSKHTFKIKLSTIKLPLNIIFLTIWCVIWKIKLAIADCQLMTRHEMDRPINIFFHLFSNNTLTIDCLKFHCLHELRHLTLYQN